MTMTSLYNRATPAQHRVLRMIEGAVKNAGDAHPEWRLTSNMARSISKRAAGTLTAHWPEVLAASVKPSERIAGSGANTQSMIRLGFQATGPKGDRRTLPRRSPLIRLWKRLAYEVGAAKRAENQLRAEILIEVLKMVAELQREQ